MSSQASSRSSSFVSEAGAGSRSSATVTLPSGETISSDKTIFTPGATSSRGEAIATTTDTSTDISVVVEAPASSQLGDVQITPSPDSPIIRIIRGNFTHNRIRGGNGNETIRGRGGDDKLVGHHGDDRCMGGAGNDTLLGGGGNDFLSGSIGDDVLVGGFGADTLVGGSGADTFVLTDRVTDLTQADIVRDFQATQGDKLKLRTGAALENVIFESFDANGDSRNDSTLIRLSPDQSIAAIVTGTVNASGQTTLTLDHFI